MRTQRRAPTLFLLAAALMFAGACDDDGGGITEPITDLEPPSIVLSYAPADSRVDHEVTLGFTVTDDLALELVTVDWGVPGEPVESIPLEGTRVSLSCAHMFAGAGQFTIVLRVRDASGREATVTHDILVTQAPPQAPVDVTVTVNRTTATITWKPGAWATGQEVVVSRMDAPEPDRIQEVENGTIASMFFPGLTWDASYTVVVSGFNTEGRAESAAVGFETPAPDPPILDRFSAAAANPACLILEWTPASAAENYRVALTGDTEADSFEEVFGGMKSAAVFCVTTHPIVDGMTYEAQVFAVLGGKEYGSNALAYTVDLDPVYSATGTWTGEYATMGGPRSITLVLDDADGQVSGTWLGVDLGSGEVSGTRLWGYLELTLSNGEWDIPFTGEITDADTIEANLDFGWFVLAVTMTRD